MGTPEHAIPTLTRVRHGYRVKTQDAHHLDVRPMFAQFRLVEIPVAEERDLARYWCYVSFEAAVLAALVWEVSADTVPVGWTRAGGARH